MKRILAALISALMIISLAACKADSGESTTQPGSDADLTVYDDSTASQNDSETLPKEVTDSKVTPDGALFISDGIYLTDIGKYSGRFVEDGSNDDVRNIISATIINTTEKSYELFEFSLTLPQGTYHFSVKSLLAHSMVKVFEKDRNFIPAKIEPVSATLESIIPFAQDPTVHLNELEITFADSIINVKNITDEPIDNIYVYYKGVEEDIFFGGITYRVSVGSVNPGETVQVVSNNFSASSSKIIFSTF